MPFELFVIVVVETLDGGFFDRSVHSLNLPIGPWVLHLGQAMLNAVLVTHPVEDVMEGIFMPLLIGELDAVVRQNRMDGIRNCFDQIAQELGCIHLSGFGIELNEGKLGCSINGNKEIELALGRLHLGNIDVKVANWVTLKLLLRLLVPLDLRQS